MFWKSGSRAEPLGVRLSDIQRMLAGTSVKATLAKSGLTVRHEHYTVWVDVVPPDTVEQGEDAIRAVVRVVAELPAQVQHLFARDPVGMSSTFNGFAALGALCDFDGSLCVGSRLTIFAQEDAWVSLHLPLLVCTVLGSTEAVLGTLHQVLMKKQREQTEPSMWGGRELGLVAHYMRGVCFCNSSESSFTAEFELQEGEYSAMGGHHSTALFRLETEEPHPSLGGGLFCLLQMPHEVRTKARLNEICMHLNRAEMQAHDLPPHFGAWCAGRRANSPAYVCFLPNALKHVPGIEVNVTLWALARSRWASAMLASLGVTA